MGAKSITPARLEYSDGLPYSALYGDIYHSADGAVGQAHHVFLQGCGLPQAWSEQPSFVVLETGFGTGLNFLATWTAWRDDPARSDRLHFLSVEKHPFTANDLSSLHAAWPEFSARSQELIAHWPMLTPGFHRLAFDDGRVILTLMLGDATDCLSQLEATVEAIYLDGFAPDRNADMWQPALFRQLARVAKPGARLASYTVAASVRAGLAEAGFACEKREGFGQKRNCLSARFNDRPAHFTKLRRASPRPRHVAVIGAGVAGCAVAHALAQRGIQVSVLEQAAAPAQGASGNPVAVFRPLPSRDDNQASRLTRAAWQYSLHAWRLLGDSIVWSRCGVVQCAKDAAHAQKLAQTLADNAAPESFARWVDVGEAAQLANWPLTGAAVFYPEGGWIVPDSLCRAWLAHPAINARYHCRVSAMQAHVDGWRLLGADGKALVEADAVVVANAYDAADLLPLEKLQGVRGQINIVPRGHLPKLDRVIAREGYVSPSPDGRIVVGATYEYDVDPGSALLASSQGDAENLRRLEAILPGVVAGDMPGRVSIRAVMPDRFPLLGPVLELPNVFIAVGYASRGVVWAGLLGETLASIICDEPRPLERDLLRAMDPWR